MQEQNYTQDIAQYLPHNSVDIVNEWLSLPHVQLRVTKYRSSKLGDYRPTNGGKQHKISVNGSLNKYSFLLTLVHEIAHMHTYINHGRRTKPHGREWKNEFKLLMSSFILPEVFPTTLLSSIENYLQNPKASSSSDVSLSLALRKFDERNEDSIVISDISLNSHFVTRNGRTFVKGLKQRKRYKCKEVSTGRFYLFNPIAEVIPA